MLFGFWVVLTCFAFAKGHEVYLSRCQLLAQNGNVVLGAHVPQCDKKGNFVQPQYSPSTGQFWCTDQNGFPTTYRTYKKPICSQILDHEKDVSRCNELAQSGNARPGAYVPQCDLYGRFVQPQYWPSTGQYWCADENGTAITYPTFKKPICSRNSVLHTCQTEREAAYAKYEQGNLGVFIPTCDCKNKFDRLQHWASTREYWCSDPEGNILTPPSKKIPNCYLQPKETDCLRQRREAEADVNATVGRYIPQCDAQGNFQPLQHHPAAHVYWCVDKDGKETKPPSQDYPKCNVPPAPPAESKCQREKKLSLATEYPEYVPTCLDNGEYHELQHDNNGWHWCADKDGNQLGEKVQWGYPQCNKNRTKSTNDHPAVSL